MMSGLTSASLSPSLGRGFATLSGRFERGDGFYTTPDDQRVAASVPARYRDWSGGPEDRIGGRFRVLVCTGTGSDKITSSGTPPAGAT